MKEFKSVFNFFEFVTYNINLSILSNRSSLKFVNLEKGLLFPKQQVLDPSKLKEISNNHFKFDENERKLPGGVEYAVGKGDIAHKEQCFLFPQHILLITSNFFFSYHIFKRFVQQTRKTQVCLSKGSCSL